MNGKINKRRAFAGALTAALVGALAAVGGVSYAATAVSHAARSAVAIVSPAAHHSEAVPASQNSGHDQYKPGYGWGDRHHNHEGRPGLKGGHGEKTPPAQSHRQGHDKRVETSIRLDEQATLYISVVDNKGHKVSLNQKGSKVGTAVSGKQVKTISYRVLVPRTIPLQLLVPGQLLVKGHTYWVNVIAVDPSGLKSTLKIPFVA